MQSGLISFDIVAKINRIDLDLRKIQKEYAITNDELSKEELVRIIKNNDFKVKIKMNSDVKDLVSKYPTPAIIVNNNRSYSVLLKVNLQDKKSIGI